MKRYIYECRLLQLQLQMIVRQGRPLSDTALNFFDIAVFAQYKNLSKLIALEIGIIIYTCVAVSSNGRRTNTSKLTFNLHS